MAAMRGSDAVQAGWGIHGKHPGFGDFVTAGLSQAAETRLVPWLAEVLTQTRDLLGEEWQPRWDAASPLRFWIGGAIWGGPALYGAWLPSRDKVGRRYPLMLVAASNRPAPTVDPDQSEYEAAEAFLHDLAANPDTMRAALSSRTAAGDAAGDLPGFWAANPDLPPAELLAQLGATDHLRATAARSYWWTAAAPGRATAFAACDRLPQAGALAWLIAGVASDPDREAAITSLAENADVG